MTNEFNLSEKISFQFPKTVGRMAIGDDFIFKEDIKEFIGLLQKESSIIWLNQSWVMILSYDTLKKLAGEKLI